MDKIYYQLKLISGFPFGTFVNFPAFNLFSTSFIGHAREKSFIKKLEEQTGRGLSYLNQDHGSKIVYAKTRGNQGDGDGLILENNLLGSVFTADCLPIIFADMSGNQVAVVHAGWKGSLEGIALKAVELLKKDGAKEIVAAIGPCARSCCYEVQIDLYNKFLASWPREAPQVFYKSNERIFLDLIRFHQLILDGVVSNLYQSSQCTICSREYHSYRRDKTSFRQVSIVGRRI
ncbi:MAG: peptidoglycan editing factor PgeF [Firmicutes bacterium]|nr:peptidoglycan editing factor PgeF [Bacillota bacterium]MDD4263101.1 peptidoglycan editing factor PgeF [Bacillota bacterium]MDD4693426.1 peptidoglycan editing factor PgeF [Bacillota bacterium]